MTTTKKPSPPAVREGAGTKPRAFRLTDEFLRKAMTPAKLKGRREVIQFEDNTGLGARISASNVSFLAQLPRKGRPPYRETIGRWGVITIEQARDRVKVLAGKIVLGIDPDDERRVEEAKVKAEAEAKQLERFTLGVLLDRWKRDHLSGQRLEYGKSAYSRVVQHFDGLLDFPAALVDRKEVRRMVEKTMSEVGPAAGRNSLVSLKAAYRWALGQDLIDSDPLNGLKLPPKTPDRERVLTLDEARAVWAASDGLKYPDREFVRLLLLMGARRNEVTGLRWEEIGEDEDGPVITIPPARTKTGAGHRIPLSKAAVEVVEECRRQRIAGSPYVLTTGGWAALTNVYFIKIRLDGALEGKVKNWTWHDTRRTIVSIMAGKGFSPIVLDKLLGHQPTSLSAIARVYQRHEHAAERRQALQAWADLLTAPPAEVVSLKSRVRKRG
jgi:integrase